MKSTEAETLLLNEHAIFNAPFIFVMSTYLTKNPTAHDIFSEIHTAHYKISTTHFVLQNHYIRH